MARATAVRLAAQGCHLVLSDIDETTLRDTAAAASTAARASKVTAVAGDIVEDGFAMHLADVALSEFGRIDGLGNLAGITHAVPFEQTTAADFDRIFAVNCKSHMLMIQAVLPTMRAARAGSIVNISSVGARVALPNLAIYGASKAAVIGLTRGVAAEVATHEIRCNAVCPGGTDTRMAAKVFDAFSDREAAVALLTGRQLFKRLADPAEIASLICYLLGPDSTFITGAVFDADGGHTTT
jgi:2-keto-3-deoxy-L-fuconate dehydrogenase